MPQSSNPLLILLFVVIATRFPATLMKLSFICRLNQETHSSLNMVNEQSSDKLNCLLLTMNKIKLSSNLIITLSHSYTFSDTLIKTVIHKKQLQTLDPLGWNETDRLYILISSHLDCHSVCLPQPLTELSSRCKYSSAKVLMRTEYSSQNPITQISFDLVQFYTLILWTM